MKWPFSQAATAAEKAWNGVIKVLSDGYNFSTDIWWAVIRNIWWRVDTGLTDAYNRTWKTFDATLDGVARAWSKTWDLASWSTDKAWEAAKALWNGLGVAYDKAWNMVSATGEIIKKNAVHLQRNETWELDDYNPKVVTLNPIKQTVRDIENGLERVFNWTWVTRNINDKNKYSARNLVSALAA